MITAQKSMHNGLSDIAIKLLEEPRSCDTVHLEEADRALSQADKLSLCKLRPPFLTTADEARADREALYAGEDGDDDAQPYHGSHSSHSSHASHASHASHHSSHER